ncbi:B30.2/SPRY domain-containing protein [Plasmodiophora brassicae]|uniref:B30.2/SPRY domain-containing protein n=1 Tax=Plasmodiophora brassicae TaxID=37360 RepID=A0A3P3Y5N9_PLABS|nr:unnamed protein product [Plasmodiophora brassicae]
MVRVKVAVDTDLVQDVLTISVPPASLVRDLVGQIHERYHLWHSFTIHEFELRSPTGELVGEPDLEVSKLVGKSTPQEVFKVTETEGSRAKREAQRLLEEEERRKREEEARIREEKRRARIAELTKIGKCWTLENNSAHIDVPLDADGLVARNKGSLDQWCTIHTLAPIPARGQFYCAVKILKLPETTNTWRICFGAVPIGFKVNAERRWVGSQKSWAYIAGTGGKCFDSGKSVDYGDKYVEGDTVGLFLDFDKSTIEFYKNGVSQGVAFENLNGPVHPAISLTAKDCEVVLVEDMPPAMVKIMAKFREVEDTRRLRWERITSANAYNTLKGQLIERKDNAWDAQFSTSKDQAIYYPDDNLQQAVNEGSGDKWRTCRSIVSYSSGVAFIEITITNDAKTTNSWKFCVGIVPSAFQCNSQRAWVGAQDSWAYIAGTGGKANNSGQSSPYGDQFGQGDKIGILVDFEAKTVEFFKNGISQGIAFRNVEGSVHAAVSMTGTGSAVTIRQGDEQLVGVYQKEAREREVALAKVIKDFANVWDETKLSSDLAIDNQGLRVRNLGSKDKWRACGGLLSYQSGRRYFEVFIEECPSSSNNWKICVGIIPKGFDFSHQKLWIGAQSSWGYIAGTGGKGFDSGRSTNYGSKFGKGDRIGVLMDFDNLTLEFFKNGVSQGIAFTQLKGPVFPAVSLTAKNSSVVLDASVELLPENVERLFLYR